MRIFARQMAAVTDQVFLSGVGGVDSQEVMVHHGITHVLNLATELFDFKYPINVQCLRVKLKDSADEDLYSHLNDLVGHIDDVVRHGGKIVVHCVAGVSRSASVCIAYLVKYHKMTLMKAYHHVLNKRDMIFPNYGFWQSLVSFEVDVHGRSSVDMLPHIVGVVPSVYREDTEFRIKRYWMRELCLMFLGHVLILLLQLATCFFT